MRHLHPCLTFLVSNVSDRKPGGCSLAGAHQPLAEAVDQFAIGIGQVVKEAVDRLDDHPPLCESGDGAEGVEARLELDGNANAQLWVILDLLTLSSAGRWPADTATCFAAVVGHGSDALARHG